MGAPSPLLRTVNTVVGPVNALPKKGDNLKLSRPWDHSAIRPGVLFCLCTTEKYLLIRFTEEWKLNTATVKAARRTMAMRYGRRGDAFGRVMYRVTTVASATNAVVPEG